MNKKIIESNPHFTWKIKTRDNKPKLKTCKKAVDISFSFSFKDHNTNVPDMMMSVALPFKPYLISISV